MDATNWRGVFSVIVTPFDAGGEIDEAAFRQLIDRQVMEGAHGIVAIGSMGEWFALNAQEAARLFEIAREQVHGRVLLLVGTSAIATDHAVTLTRAAKRIGCDGAMVLPPPFVMPTYRETLAHFEKVAAVGLPLMVYNNPKRTQINIHGTIIEEIARIDEVVALKDSVSDILQMTNTIQRVGDRIECFVGLEQYGMTMVQRGASGITSVGANVCAPEIVGYFNKTVSGDIEGALQHQKVIDELYRLISAYDIGLYPFLKACMNVLGRNGGYPRRPFLPMEEGNLPALKQALMSIGLEAIA